MTGSPADRKQWATPRVVARMWWCGDDHCDCTEPIIEQITPNLVAGYPWIHRESLWVGTFLTDTSTEPDAHDRQWQELATECAARGLEVPTRGD